MVAPSSELTIYRGRFAPSPTGPLHFGSLVAAVGSYLQARTHNGEWLLRIEDLDPPREQQGASIDIIHTIAGYGFEWDGEISYQSQRYALYQNALEQLIDSDHCFACGCSRKDIQLHASSIGIDPGIYPGICRYRAASELSPDAIRVKVLNHHIDFYDLVQGQQRIELADEVGDFVIRRADGLYAYQLAVAVDDAAQGISEVVRGSDLLSSTPHQYYLQQLLGYPHPDYIHLPLVINREGKKLSKQSYARAITLEKAAPNLIQALQFLGQNPDEALSRASVRDIWAWAIENWQLTAVPTQSCCMLESHHEQ